MHGTDEASFDGKTVRMCCVYLVIIIVGLSVVLYNLLHGCRPEEASVRPMIIVFLYLENSGGRMFALLLHKARGAVMYCTLGKRAFDLKSYPPVSMRMWGALLWPDHAALFEHHVYFVFRLRSQWQKAV